jgi:pimeloyl-ACP methyl ester carboxylesterase
MGGAGWSGREETRASPPRRTVLVESYVIELPSGIRLSCRASGSPAAPVLLFLHGFPEAAFVWDALLEHFADAIAASRRTCAAIDASSAPAEVEAYRAKHIVGDIAALIRPLGGRSKPWWPTTGAAPWPGTSPAQQGHRLRRLVIVNSPHPATFLRGLSTTPSSRPRAPT